MPLIILFTLLIITIFWLDNRLIYHILYVLLNLLFLLIFFVSLEIQTSAFPFVPWHQPGGMPTVVIAYLAIWLTALGCVQFVLAQRIPIGNSLKYLPFIGAAVLGFNVFLSGNSASVIQIFGSIAAAFLVLAQIILFALNFRTVFMAKS